MKSTPDQLRRDIALPEASLISFCRLDPENSEQIRSWRNHESIRQWMYTDHIISVEEHLKFLESLKTDDNNFLYMAVHEANLGVIPTMGGISPKSQGGRMLLGVISLNRVNFTHRHAYIGIYGNPESTVKGIGKLLMACLTRLAFEKAGFHTLRAEVLADNERAVNLYKRTGFVEEGRLRHYVFKQGEWKDVSVMSLLNPQEEEQHHG